MLNEWNDRDHEPRAPKRWHVAAIVIIGALIAWSVVQALWSLVAN